MKNSSAFWQAAPPLALGAGLAVIYLATMAPGLTWANDGADGGDLIAAAASGGVAHPSGYPLYLLLARLFQLLPLGSLAFRTNLMSGLCTVGAALLVFVITHRALDCAGRLASSLGAFVAGLAFGLAPLVWSQAVITEVYALNLLLVALLLYHLTLPVRWPRLQGGLVGLVQGLAIGNQVLAVLMLPATLLAVGLRQRVSAGALAANQSGRPRWNVQALASACAGLAAGLLVYSILPLRAAMHPPINWGDPETGASFIWLVSGRLYQGELLPAGFSSLWIHVQAGAALLLQQFGWAGLAVGLLGLIVFFKSDRLYFLTLWVALAYTLFAVQYQAVDSYVYLLPACLAFSIWMGLGLGRTVHYLSAHSIPTAYAVGAICLAYLAVFGFQHWPQVDASHDMSAELYGQRVMAIAPAGAILLAQGDQAVFALWYFHYALHQRPDVAVVATDLLPFDWYRANLQHAYSDLVLPASTQLPWTAAIRASNPARPACYPYALEAVLNCQ